MAEVARAHPRHWDGRRLLRFLTGLALLALAFAAPVFAAPGPAVPDAITQPALRTVTHAPAELAVQTAGQVSAQRAADATVADDSAADRSGITTPAGTPNVTQPAGGAQVDGPAGTALAAHGSRGPPRH